MAELLQNLINQSASASPQAEALVYQGRSITYVALADGVSRMGAAYLGFDLGRSERVAV